WKVQGARPPQQANSSAKPSWSPGAVAVSCWLGAVACFVFGPLLGLAVMQEQEKTAKLRATGTPEPEFITLRQLVARGADGNAHLAITDFELSSRLIFFADQNRAFARWESVWIPVLAKDQENLDTFRVLLVTQSISGQRAVEELAGRKSLAVWVHPL